MHNRYYSDRIRTTNNMLGDCYAAAIVEKLSKKELMALDAAILYQDTPVTPNGHILVNSQSSVQLPETVIIDMNNTSPAQNGNAKK